MINSDRSPWIFESEGFYQLLDSHQEEISGGRGTFQVGADVLGLMDLAMSSPRLYSYRDFQKVESGDYQVILPLVSGGRLILSKLGLKYEDLIRELSFQRHTLLLTDLLADEGASLYQCEGQIILKSPEGSVSYQGPGTLQLYPKSIAFFPLYGEGPVSIPLGSIQDIIPGDYAVKVHSYRGLSCELSKLGSQHTPFCQRLSDLLKSHLLSIQSMLKEIHPDLPPMETYSLAQLFKEGVAVPQMLIQEASVSFWEILEKLFKASGPEYPSLTLRMPPDKLSVGIQRGIWGDAEQVYTWGLFPVYSLNAERPGNSIILEALTGSEDNKATYVFRIMDPEEYGRMTDIKSLESKMEETRKLINDCLIDIRFRREPLYLADENLAKPEGRDYRYSVKCIPALERLRPLFAGRVIHSSPEQWESDLNKLLLVNIKSKG